MIFFFFFFSNRTDYTCVRRHKGDFVFNIFRYYINAIGHTINVMNVINSTLNFILWINNYASYEYEYEREC